MKKKVVIIGGGASGLICAIKIKQNNPNYSIIVLENNNRIGKKILKTGNGKCNLSNFNMHPKYYNNQGFVSKCLEKYSVEQVIEFFRKLGLLIKSDDNSRLYPFSETATSVLDIIRRELKKLDISIICSVQKITISKKDKFDISFNDDNINADYLVLACGSLAQSEVDGYELAKSLGHSITSLQPGLVPLKTKTTLKSINGIRAKCKAQVIENNDIIYVESGEILFKNEGISGILTLNLSRYARKGSKVVLDFFEQIDNNNLDKILKGRSLNEALLGALPKMLAIEVERNMVINNKPVIDKIRNYSLDIIGTYGFNLAQTTLGGVSIDEINDNFSSKKAENLFIIGEMLDIDGASGGYNLHFAWISGMIAADSICFEKR